MAQATANVLLDLNDLNPRQREAVEAVDGPVLIIAGPGSGKTKVVAYRVAHLILDHGVNPWNILAVTFTNKAGNEMRQRVEQLVGGDREGLSIGTFHAMCSKLLRREIGVLGWPTDFTIADRGQQETLIGQILRDLQIDHRFSVAQALGPISRSKNDLRTADDFAR
ncbi:MAG: UvrD-helicase domain-containing protein, partial [Chloroflexota bacterium]